MSDNIITLNKELIHTELKDLVKNSVEETLNAMLDAEADRLVNAERYARDEERRGYRAGHYDRTFTTTAGNVNLSEILGAAEGLKEDLESWKSFFVWLKQRGLQDPRLIIGDKALGMVEAIGQVFPKAKYQRCIVHFYRNVFSVTPNKKVKEVAKMLKAIHAQEDRPAALEKAKAVEEKLRGMKLSKAADKVRDSIKETLTYMNFPEEHWMRIRTNNTLERINREIKRRTKVVGTFPDGESALMLVCARLRHVASSNWGTKRYLNMNHLTSMIISEEESVIAC